MNKKVKIINFNPLEIELLEDCKKGEIINLSSIFDESSTQLNNLINNFIETKYSEKLNEQKQELNIEFKKFLNESLKAKELELQNKFIQEKNQLNESINNLKKENELIQKETTQKLKEEFIKEQNNLIKEIHTLKIEKENIQKQTRLEVEKENSKEINDLKIIITEKDGKINNLKIAHEKELSDQENELKSFFQNELKLKEEEISNLKHQKNLMGTKEIGEELENHCWNEIQNKLINYIGDDSISMNKIETIDHSKADFIVEFKDPNNNEFIQPFIIILEMKNESLKSKEENKKTNESHLKKLVNDAEKKNADVAILVTELEKQDDFLFRRINNKIYHTDMDIYMIRPVMLIYILSLLRLIYIKYISIQSIEDYEFKEKQKIIDEFNEFKDCLLDNQVKNIETQITSIIKSAETISKQADSIKDSARIIVDRHLDIFKRKINDYNIEKKIIKKMERIEKLK